MTAHHQSTKPKTRSEFNSRLQSLSARNEELEESLRKAEETCQEYKAKSKAQHGLVQDLMEIIHSLTFSPPDDNESSGGGEKDAKIPEKIFLLLTKSARRVSELSEELEEMKSRLKKQMRISSSFRKSCVDDADESEHDEDDAEFVDVYLCDNENDYIRSGTAPSSFSSPQPPVSGQETIKLEEELVCISSKCKSLERSLTTLKRKSAERELRSMKSLRNMRHQVETLEQERRRRLNLQTEAEERALQLEIEIMHLKQENHRQDIFRRPESADNSIMREGKQIESDTLAENGVDDCREAIMLRNQQDKNSFPPLLLVVSEESEDSEDSQESGDDFRPCVKGAVTSE